MSHWVQANYIYFSFLEERHSLLGGYPSNSDVSSNLCEIEDSECEAEQKPLNNSYIGSVQQTSVWHTALSGSLKKARFVG